MTTPTSKPCVFCKIIRGDEQSYHVFEDEASLAFLDRRPLFPGHCLLVPKGHYETLSDLPPALIAPLFTNAQLLARAVEHGLEAHGSFVAINNHVSQSVPHLHIHIVPRRQKDGLKGFFWPRHPYQDRESMLKIQQALRAAIAQLHVERAP
jgi:histidine triad (HIT) family protein